VKKARRLYAQFFQLFFRRVLSICWPGIDV
jgi:hypothetical protein